MSGAIKPPGGSAGPIEGPEAAGELDEAREAAASAPASEASPGATGTAAWLQRVDAGEITAEQAVDGIVAEALDAQATAGLSPVQRSELESLLRAALLDDPVLSSLVGG